MNLYVCMQTHSTCYKSTRKMEIKGILWHSTGANNPYIKRYVQPYEGDANYNEAIAKLGKNVNGNDWNHIYHEAGLNAWIGKFADGSVGTCQTMPWDYRPWGCGAGSKGSCNNGWIQFEICEDNLQDKNYAQKVWDEAVEFSAYICKLYGLNPLATTKCGSVTVPVITCHNDAYKLGVGSGHIDINHWFPKLLGKNMENARQEIAAKMGKIPTPTPTPTPKPTKNYLEKGDKGEDVKVMQTMLITCGYSCGSCGVDGSFGSDTETAVKNFQRDHRLTVDGLYGPNTKAALEKDYKQKTKTELYRVRIAWDKPKTQIGAYKILKNAINACKPGYSVFDSNGKVVYNNNTKKSNEEIAREVIHGKWGNGADRRNKLEAAGYNYSAIQDIVNRMLG